MVATQLLVTAWKFSASSRQNNSEIENTESRSKLQPHSSNKELNKELYVPNKQAGEKNQIYGRASQSF